MIYTADIQKRLDEIQEEPNKVISFDKKQRLEKEYSVLSDILVNDQSTKNYERLLKFYKKYIKGKKLDKINPEDWEFYKDFHEEVFGFKPSFLKFGQWYYRSVMEVFFQLIIIAVISIIVAFLVTDIYYKKMLATFEDMLNHYSNDFYKVINDFIEYLNSEIDEYENEQESVESDDKKK